MAGIDKDVLGGNYQGHYGTMKEPVQYSVVPEWKLIRF